MSISEIGCIDNATLVLHCFAIIIKRWKSMLEEQQMAIKGALQLKWEQMHSIGSQSDITGNQGGGALCDNAC